MKKLSGLYSITLILTLSLFHLLAFSQNKVGLGAANPEARLHIKGVDNISQLCIDADTQQTNLYPLIRLRKSDGTDLLWIHSDGPSNLFMGLNAGRVNNPDLGLNNTFIGTSAGYSNINGDDNIALGKETLYTNVNGTENIAIGNNSLHNNYSSRNIAIGNNALKNSGGGFDNTAVGCNAMENNTSGDDNTAIGTTALYSNGFGSYNTAIGKESLRQNTTGSGNVGLGYGSLYNNTDGDQNIGIGFQALVHNTTSHNTAIGYRALFENTAGFENVAVGFETLYKNTNGNYNSATGTSALYSNTTGAGNAAFGYQALYNNTTQIQNTSLGNETLFNTTASGNTAVGFLAGHDHDNGDNNTYLGYYADANAPGFQNSTAIGSSTDVTASNQVRIGTSVTSIGGPQNWTNTSDRRIKVNVRSDVPGLAFINLLQPVTYNKSIALEEEIIGNRKDNVISPDNPYETIRYTGFIAQDVEAAAQSIGYEFSGVDAPQNDKSLYGLRYAEFVVPLVKAVQELTNQNVLLQAEIELLKTQFASLQSEITRLKEGK